MSIFTEYGIKAQIPEAHDLLFTDRIEIQGNTIGGNGTPEEPIAIQSVTSPITIVNCGKNIYRLGTFLYGYNATHIKDSDNQITITSTNNDAGARYVSIKYGNIPVGNYYLSFNKTTNCNYISIYGRNAENTGQYIGPGVYGISIRNFSSSGTLTIPSGYVEFYFLFYLKNDTASGQSGTYSNIQLEKGSTATEYEPYQGTTLSIPIKDTNNNELTLRRVGTAYDRIYKEGNKWYLRKAINERVLNGSEHWSAVSDKYYTSMADAKRITSTFTISNILLTTHPTKSMNQISAGENGAFFSYGNLGIRDVITFEDFTAEDLKTWLSTHNITIAYELATPQIIELHEDTATALDNLTALTPINRISTNSPEAVIDISKGLSVSYGTSNRVNFKIPSTHNDKAVTRIKEDGFSYNNNLTFLYIPESIEELGDRALNNNINITDIYINRPSSIGITTCGANMFDNCPKLTNIYVSDNESLIAYKEAPNWSYYSGKIKLL